MLDLAPETPSKVVMTKSKTFRADLKWFAATVGIGWWAYADIDKATQHKVDTLERREEGHINRLETKVDAILIGLHIPIPQEVKDGGQ